MTKFYFIVVLFQLSFISLAQEEAPIIKVTPFENIPEKELNDEKLSQLSDQSKTHIIQSSKEQINQDELELIDVEIVTDYQVPTSLIKDLDLASLHKRQSCNSPFTPSPLNILGHDLDKIFNNNEKPKRYIYFTWGYNRNFHSKSDATFETQNGTFTVHDTVGYDRPSYDWKDYVYPNRLPIPQYNLRIGYEINDRFDIVAGLDHMKWVFQNDLKYEVSGDYDRTVFVPHSSGDPHLLEGLTFDQVKERGDLRWLRFEHTDGFNYVHLGGIYKANIFESKNKNWSLDSGFGAGAGLLIPQTSVMYHQDSWWNLQGVDNRFHIAGFGAHAETKLQLGYKNFFLEPIVRGSYIKVQNALVQQSGERLSQTPIGSIQFILQAGYKIPIKQRKRSLSAP